MLNHFKYFLFETSWVTQLLLLLLSLHCTHGKQAMNLRKTKSFILGKIRYLLLGNLPFLVGQLGGFRDISCMQKCYHIFSWALSSDFKQNIWIWSTLWSGVCRLLYIAATAMNRTPANSKWMWLVICLISENWCNALWRFNVSTLK